MTSVVPVPFPRYGGAPRQWICCQLGAREHYAVPRALHRCGALELLVTDTWVRPSNAIRRLKPSLHARFHPDLVHANVQAANAASIAFELRAKAAGLRDWPRMIARNRWFQKMAVARLSRTKQAPSRVIMAYSYVALDIFRLARARGWRTVLGQIDPGPPEEAIVAKLYRASPEQGQKWTPAPPTYWSQWREECEIADRIVVNSAWSRDALLKEGVPPEKLRIVPLAYERPTTNFHFREYPTHFTASRPLRVLFLGLVSLRKGVGSLLDAIRMLDGLPIEFSFVGSLQISVPADLREHPKVRWIGTVPRDATARFYREADVFIFPTFSDGFGMTQLEALAWKLPIIASKFCGEVVEHDQNGWVLPDVTPNSLVEVLRRCLNNPDELQKLAGWSGNRGRFEMNQVGSQWLNVIQ